MDTGIQAGYAVALKIQRCLESCYGLSPGADVQAFILHEESARTPWLAPGMRRPPEQLLLLEEPDGLALALYIDAEVLAVFANSDPFARLEQVHLQSFLLVVEGVSHFRYVLDRAIQNREFNLLELELQAEVDKYLLVRRLLEWQWRTRMSSLGLSERLFGHVQFAGDLPEHEQERYVAAHRWAARYCEQLDRTPLDGARDRFFWHCPLYEKLGLIDKRH